MAEVEIDLSKSLEKNASDYFDKSKTAKRKLAGLKKAIEQTKRKLGEARKSIPVQKALVKKRKRMWYEKFRWFFTSDGLLVFAGRDAKTNEAVVKKHMRSQDLYFHAEVDGAPHVILETDKNTAPEKSMQEAAIFALSFSKAWQSGVSAGVVYSVLPEQVSKSAPSGESLSAGAFVISGTREWFKKTPVELSIGLEKSDGDYRVISGPVSAVHKNSLIPIDLVQGDLKKSDIAKKIIEKFEEKAGKACVSTDEIVSMLPPGLFSLKKR